MSDDYEFGRDGPPFAFYRNGADDVVAYEIITSADHRDEPAAWSDFDQTFAKWLDGRPLAGVSWRRRPSPNRSCRGAFVKIDCRCGYDTSLRSDA